MTENANVPTDEQRRTLLDATIILIYEYKRRLRVIAVFDVGDEWGFGDALVLRYSALKTLLKEITAADYQVIRWQDMKPEVKRVMGDVPLPPIYSAHRALALDYAGKTIMQIHNLIVTGKHYTTWQSHS